MKDTPYKKQQGDYMISKRKFPWMAKQNWSNILFIHWPVSLSMIEPLVPSPFKIDTFHQSAWISIVVFCAERSQLRFIPDPFKFPSVTQINVRTYVTVPQSAERGVYFFNLYVKNRLAIFGAKTLFHLPFSYLQTEMTNKSDGSILVTGKSNLETIFSVRYTAQNENEKEKDELAHFLTERYCIWNVKEKQVIKVPILHSLWDLQKVNATIKTNTLLPNLSSDPLFHFCPYKRAILFPYERLR